jgi:hypothetical protein
MLMPANEAVETSQNVTETELVGLVYLQYFFQFAS